MLKTIDTASPKHLPSLPGTLSAIDMARDDGMEERSSAFLVGHGKGMVWCKECGTHHVAPSSREEHVAMQCKAEFESPTETPPEIAISLERLILLENCCKGLRDALIAEQSVLNSMGGISTFGTSALKMYDKLFPKKIPTPDESLGDTQQIHQGPAEEAGKEG